MLNCWFDIVFQWPIPCAVNSQAGSISAAGLRTSYLSPRVLCTFHHVSQFVSFVLLPWKNIHISMKGLIHLLVYSKKNKQSSVFLLLFIICWVDVEVCITSLLDPPILYSVCDCSALVVSGELVITIDEETTGLPGTACSCRPPFLHQ